MVERTYARHHPDYGDKARAAISAEMPKFNADPNPMRARLAAWGGPDLLAEAAALAQRRQRLHQKPERK